jgi:hypothetical protein
MKNILNFSELDPETLDKAKGIVYGVSLCSTGPARGHGLQVDATTLHQLLESAEMKGKIPTKLDHKTGIAQVCGFLTDFWIDSGKKLRANWHLLKSQPSFAHTWQLIENLHDVCGLSCSFTGDAEGDRARCRELISCDFVPHPATGSGLFSRGDLDTQDEEDNMNEPIDEDQIAELLHELLDHIEQIEAQNAALAEALDALQGDDDEAGDEDEPVLEESGARAGPGTNDHRALLQSHDFESRIEEFQLSGMDAKAAHIAALKEFARSKYATLNL